MLTFLDGLRELNMASLVLRLMLAMLFGGLTGLNGSRKRRAAGFRTYMLVCMGSALTVLMAQYCVVMLHSNWMKAAYNVGLTTDVSRFSAQVINGIGFLGAGTVLVTGRQEVKGLTTAAGLWASACMGLAIGAGFYECVIVGFALIVLSVWVLPVIESSMVERASHMNIYVEFKSINHLSGLIGSLKAHNVHIYDIDIERENKSAYTRPSAVIMMHLDSRIQHTKLISALADMEGVYSIKEI